MSLWGGTARSLIEMVGGPLHPSSDGNNNAPSDRCIASIHVSYFPYVLSETPLLHLSSHESGVSECGKQQLVTTRNQVKHLMKTRKEFDMESQKDPQQEQSLSQEGLHSLEEEQLQNVTGGGKLGKFLSCFTCGKSQQSSASSEWVPVTALFSGASSPVPVPPWSNIPSRVNRASPGSSDHGPALRRAVSDPSLHGSDSSGSALPPFERAHSR